MSETFWISFFDGIGDTFSCMVGCLCALYLYGVFVGF